MHFSDGSIVKRVPKSKWKNTQGYNGSYCWQGIRVLESKIERDGQQPVPEEANEQQGYARSCGFTLLAQ